MNVSSQKEGKKEKKRRKRYCKGTSDATTSPSLIVSVFMMSIDDFSVSKQLYSSFKNNWGRTDGRTDGRMDTTFYRDAWSLKKREENLVGRRLSNRRRKLEKKLWKKE